MKSIVKGNTLHFKFSGDMDNFQVARFKQKSIQIIDKHQCEVVKFDFNEVGFVDSTGIGYVLARYNQIQAYGGTLVVKNLSSSVKRIFALSGIFSIIEEENYLRKETA